MPSASSAAFAKYPTRGEEIANSLSHGLGLVLAIAGLPILTLIAQRAGDVSAVVGAAIFGVSAILLYLASTLYHAIGHPRIKAILRLLDHAVIYLLIAGTYTPIALGVLHGSWGWAMLGTIWTLALAGLIFKALAGMRFPRASTFLYLAMGWVAVIAIRPLWLHMAPARIGLVAGRRHGLQRRGDLLRARREVPLQPFHLAPVRARRHDLPFFRGAALCHLIPASTKCLRTVTGRLLRRLFSVLAC